MSTAKYVGRVGALAVALGVGFAVATTPAVAYAEPADSSRCSSFDSPSPDSTALIMGGTTIPTPDDLGRNCQEPVHRADTSGPGHRLLRGDDA